MGDRVLLSDDAAAIVAALDRLTDALSAGLAMVATAALASERDKRDEGVHASFHALLEKYVG